MLKVYICEDDGKQREIITKAAKGAILAEKLDMEIEMASADPLEILSGIQKNDGTAGVYFLDVELNADLNGIELGSRIRGMDPNGHIYYITTHPELSYLTFKYKVGASDYIIKDGKDNLDVHVKRCLLDAESKRINKKINNNKFFYIKHGQSVLHIPMDEILYFRTSDVPHKIIMHTLKRRVEFYGYMGEIIEELDDSFYRCHKSYIINTDQITMVDKKNKKIHLNGDSVCDISTKALKELYE